jgi:hypothetical protein
MGNSASPIKVENPVNGRSLLPLPGFVKSRVCWCIGEVEKLQGKPGTIADIYTVWRYNYTGLLNQGHIIAIL